MSLNHGGSRALHGLFQRTSYRGRHLIGWPSCRARLPCGESSSALWPLSPPPLWLAGWGRAAASRWSTVEQLDEESKSAVVAGIGECTHGSTLGLRFLREPSFTRMEVQRSIWIIHLIKPLLAKHSLGRRKDRYWLLACGMPGNGKIPCTPPSDPSEPLLLCLPCKHERSHVQVMANPIHHGIICARVSCDGAADGPGLLIRVEYRCSRKP